MVHLNAREIYPSLPEKFRRRLSAPPLEQKPEQPKPAAVVPPKFDPADPLPYLLALADTDPQRANLLLGHYFCYQLENGGMPDQLVLIHVGKCIRRILNGDDPLKSLGLADKRGHPLEDDKRLDIATDVLRLVLDGMSPTDAVKVVANKRRRAGVRSVRKCFEDFEEAARFALNVPKDE